MLCLAVLGCAGPVREPAEPQPSGISPPAEDAVVYDLDSAVSEIEIRVYRDGPLAAMGHNHVIMARQVRGQLWLADDPTGSRGEMSFAAQNLEVDPPERRSIAGEDFPGELDQDAIEGTRTNMLGERVLNAESFPELRLTLTGAKGDWQDLRVDAQVQIRGGNQPLVFPAALQRDGCSLRITGSTQVTHSELGLEPFSVMMGALAVREEIDLLYVLIAARSDCQA